MNPSELKYTESHEWVHIDGLKCTVGITDHAQEQLGDIVFVDLPQEGADISQGEVLGSIESVKSVSDVYSPVSGKVIQVNEKLLDNPELLNQDPLGEGWIAILELADTDNLGTLLTPEEYQTHI